MKDIDFDELDRAVNSVINPPKADNAKSDKGGATPPASKWEGFAADSSSNGSSSGSSTSDASAQSDDAQEDEAKLDSIVAQNIAAPAQTTAQTTDEPAQEEASDQTPSTQDTPEQIQPSVDAPQVVTQAEIAEEVTNVEDNVIVEEIAAPAPQPVVQRPTATPAARRRSGLFMDVVHTNSASESDKEESKPLARPVRFGRSFDFTNAPQRPTVNGIQSPTPSAPAPVSTSAIAPKQEPAASDFLAPHNEIAWLDSAAKQPADANEPDQAPAASIVPDGPMNSLFVSDAKVEKRPLGAFNDNQSSDQPPATNQQPDEDSQQSQTDQQPVADDEPAGDSVQSVANSDNKDDSETQESSTTESLPPELTGDIVAVEADNESEDKEDKGDEADVPPAPVRTQEAAPNKAAATIGMSSVASVPSVSIPKQYQQAVAQKTDAANPVFDIKEYHPPIAPGAAQVEPAHHKIALWVIVALILLIATIAGFGYWFYVLL